VNGGIQRGDPANFLAAPVAAALVDDPGRSRRGAAEGAPAGELHRDGDVQGQGTTPDAVTQVQAIQSRVSAVATAPSQVQTAISQAKANRDPVKVSRHEISVTSLGSSAIMMLTVTDPSPQVAVALAGSLAKNVVSELNQLGIKDNPELASAQQDELTARQQAQSAALPARFGQRRRTRRPACGAVAAVAAGCGRAGAG
jgi:hypothetical protein